MTDDIKRTSIATSRPNYSFDPETGEIQIRPREKLLERLPVSGEHNDAFDRLHERLAVASEFFLHHGDGGRYGVYRAIGDVIGYLEERGIPLATLQPLHAVMAAIVDADNGAESPIFKPARSASGGSPPKPVAQLEFEGKMAIVMECCVRHCRDQKMRPFVEPASRMAARMINESKWPVRVTARELVELRERVQQRRGGHSPDRIELDISLSSDVAKAHPLDWARALLAHEWVSPLPKISD